MLSFTKNRDQPRNRQVCQAGTKTPSKRAEIDLRLSFLPREAFIFGSSTKTEPLHDLRQRPVHEVSVVRVFGTNCGLN